MLKLEFDKNGKLILIKSNTKIRHEKWLEELIKEVESIKGGDNQYGEK